MCFLKSNSTHIVSNSIYVIDNYFIAVKNYCIRLKLTTVLDLFLIIKEKVPINYSALYLYTNQHLN